MMKMRLLALVFIALLGTNAWSGQDSSLPEAFSALSAKIKHERANAWANSEANPPDEAFLSPDGFVRLNVYVCRSSGIHDGIVAEDIARAKKTLAQCGISVVAPPPPYPRFIMANGRCNLQTDEDAPKFSDAERDLIARYHDGRSGTITAFYFSWDSADPNMAGTSLPADYVEKTKASESAAFKARATGAVFIFQSARDAMSGARFTLPHEMTHILTADSSHLHDPADARNLMYRPLGAADPNFIPGDKLNAAQCQRMRELSARPAPAPTAPAGH